MEEVENVLAEDVQELVKSFPLVPTRNRLVITVNTISEDEDGLMLSQTQMDEEQYVIAAGSHVHEIMAGDKILLDMNKIMQYRPNPENANEKIGYVEIDPIHVNDRVYAMINDTAIKAFYKK